MGKKSNRRSRANRKRTAAREAKNEGRRLANDVIVGPGFRMERHGRFIQSTVKRTPEQQRALIEHFAKSVDEQTEAVRRGAEELATLLRSFDTFAVLGAVSLINHLANPETYREPSHEGKSIVAEYVTLLALRGAYSTGTELYPNGRALNEIQEKAEKVVRDSVWLHMCRDARRMLSAADEARSTTPRPDAFGRVQLHMKLYELGVRNPAYSHHHYDVLRGLFGPFEAALVRVTGLSIDDALRASDAIPTRMSRLFQERMDKARESRKDLLDEIDCARRGVPPIQRYEDNEKHRAFVRDLSTRPQEWIDSYLRNAMTEWLFVGADGVCTFTEEELAGEAGIPIERAAAFVSMLSSEFGAVPVDFFEPTSTHPLRTRPIVRHERRAIAPAPMLLDWAIQPAFEGALKRVGGTTWERYQRHRHDYLLDRTLELLGKLMPSAATASELLYTIDGEAAREAELDGLIQYDSMVFLIEAKGRDVTDPARRGAPDRLRRDLSAVIADSHEQAVRARTFLDSAMLAGTDARFRRAAGGDEVVVAAGSAHTKVLVSATLAPLGHITASLHSEESAGLFKPGEYSWVVSLYDLMVIADILDQPFALPHYLTRRLATARLGFLAAPDELDLLGYYLKEGLYLDDVAAEMRSDSPTSAMRLASYTVMFDDYYAYGLGQRETPASKPGQVIPRHLLGLLQRVERSTLPGRLDVAIALLDLDSKGRTKFSQGILQASTITIQKKRASNVTIAGKERGGWGISYWSGTSTDGLAASLGDYCARKRTELGARTWYGVGEVVTAETRAITALSVFVDRSAPDPKSTGTPEASPTVRAAMPDDLLR